MRPASGTHKKVDVSLFEDRRSATIKGGIVIALLIIGAVAAILAGASPPCYDFFATTGGKCLFGAIAVIGLLALIFYPLKPATNSAKIEGSKTHKKTALPSAFQAARAQESVVSHSANPHPSPSRAISSRTRPPKPSNAEIVADIRGLPPKNTTDPWIFTSMPPKGASLPSMTVTEARVMMAKLKMSPDQQKGESFYFTWGNGLFVSRATAKGDEFEATAEEFAKGKRMDGKRLVCTEKHVMKNPHYVPPIQPLANTPKWKFTLEKPDTPPTMSETLAKIIFEELGNGTMFGYYSESSGQYRMIGRNKDFTFDSSDPATNSSEQLMALFHEHREVNIQLG